MPLYRFQKRAHLGGEVAHSYIEDIAASGRRLRLGLALDDRLGRCCSGMRFPNAMRSGVGSDVGSSLERRIFNQLLASRKRPGVSLLDHVGELVGDKQAAVRLVWIFAAAEMNVFLLD